LGLFLATKFSVANASVIALFYLATSNLHHLQWPQFGMCYLEQSGLYHDRFVLNHATELTIGNTCMVNADNTAMMSVVLQ